MNKIGKLLYSLIIRGYTFGFRLAFSHLLLIFLRPFGLPSWAAHIVNWQQKQIKKKIGNFISELDLNSCTGNDLTSENADGIIWFCWLQGEEKMPPIPQLCLKSIRKFSNGHQVITITLQNYKHYVTLPGRIEKLFSEGKMSAAHFSDCLRLNLLNQRGGLWLDATILLVRDIENEVFKMPFFSVKTPEHGNYVSRCRWAVFCIASPRQGYLIDRITYCINQYWAKWDCVVDYLFLDYIMDYFYAHDRQSREQLDAIPYNNPSIHDLKMKLCDDYNPDIIGDLCRDNFMFKLNWRLYSKEQLAKQNTIYKHFERLLDNE